MPTPHQKRPRHPFAVAAVTLASALFVGHNAMAGTAPDDDLLSQLERLRDIVVPTSPPSTDPAPTEPALPEQPPLAEPGDQGKSSAPPPEVVGPEANTSNEPSQHAITLLASLLIFVAMIAVAFSRRGRLRLSNKARSWRRTSARTRRLAPRAGSRHVNAPIRNTAEGSAATDAVTRCDSIEVAWIQCELRLLAQLVNRAGQPSTTVQLVQLDDARSLEVAFTEIPGTAPTTPWVSAADRVWRLGEPHDDETLETVRDAPAIVPALVTLGGPRLERSCI